MSVRDPRDPRYVNPGWTAPAAPKPPRHRPSAAAYALAVVLPLFLLLLLAVPLGVVLAIRSARAGEPPAAGSNAPPGRPSAGEAGAGDPYFPDYGSSGYDALKYAISI